MPAPETRVLMNVTRGRVVAGAVSPARTLLQRGLGLLARPPLRPGEGLWLCPCGSVHTWGMRYALDILFLGRDGRVLRVSRALRPWKIGWAPRGTHSVVELPSGGAAPVREGDRLLLEPPRERG